MIVNADVKGLEVVCAAQLSGDKTLCQEVLDDVDIHEENRKAFNLPARVIAKIFKFRLIYGGSAYSYAHDPDFMGVSSSEKYWQKVIDAYYEKYSGIAVWHGELLETAMRQGFIEIPSGRHYTFQPTRNGWGQERWPLTTIKNYPVQGFGADLVKLARIKFFKDLQDSGLEALFIGTIHDSLIVDTPEKNCYTISMMLRNAIEAVPKLVKEHWDYDFQLPLKCEVQAGPSKALLEDI